MNMCKVKDPSVLRNTEVNHLTSLNFQKIAFELQLKAPTLTHILKSCVKRTDNEVALCVLSSLILRYRNDKISRLHHVVGQILDRGGATDETLDNKALVTFGTVSWPRFCIQKVYGNGIPTKKIDQTACERTNSTKSVVRPNQEDQNYGGKSEG